jgi:hypothetical protein
MKLLYILKEVLLSETSLSKPLVLGKDVVDRLRNMNSALDSELNDSVYDDSDRGIYAKGGAARLGLLLYKDLLNGTENHKGDIVRDQDFVWIVTSDQRDRARKLHPNMGIKYMPWGELAYGGFLKNEKLRKLAITDDRDLDIIASGDYSEYFNSRDITLNQALINRNELIVSRKALRDIDRKLINPVKGTLGKSSVWSAYEDEDEYRIRLTPRMYYRMALFAARYGYDIPTQKEFANMAGSSYNDYFLNEASLLDYYVPLFKAYELGIEKQYLDLIGQSDTYNIAYLYYIALRWVNQNKNVMSKMKSELIDMLSLEKSKGATLKNKNIDADYVIEYIYSVEPEIEKEVRNLVVDEKDDSARYYEKYIKKLNRIKKTA